VYGCLARPECLLQRETVEQLLATAVRTLQPKIELN
jgi:hypothetical protein